MPFGLVFVSLVFVCLVVCLFVCLFVCFFVFVAVVCLVVCCFFFVWLFCWWCLWCCCRWSLLLSMLMLMLLFCRRYHRHCWFRCRFVVVVVLVAFVVVVVVGGVVVVVAFISGNRKLFLSYTWITICFDMFDISACCKRVLHICLGLVQRSLQSLSSPLRSFLVTVNYVCHVLEL